MGEIVAAMSEGDFQRIVDETKKDLSDINEKLLRMGKNYIKCLSAGEGYATRFKEQFPNISTSKWELFALAGMGKIAPGLVVYSQSGFGLIKRLPIGEQETLLSKPIDVLVIGKDGKVDTIKAEFKNLSIDQQRQVVSYDHIRSLPEQRTHIEDRRTREWTKSAAPENKRYIITGNKIVFPAKSEFTDSEIWAIAKEMAGQKK
jgi:hypothetical protein